MTIAELCKELSSKYDVSASDLQASIEANGFVGAAAELGYNISDFKFSKIAGRLLVEHNRSVAPKTFLDAMKTIKESKVGVPNEIWDFIRSHAKILQDEIDKYKSFEDDYYDFFSGSVMCTFYSKKIKGTIVETPSYVFMRSAVQAGHIYGIGKVLEYFNLYITGRATPPTPFMNNACTLKSQLGSCFLMNFDDTMKSILKTSYEAGMVSSEVGGLGIGMSRIRNNSIRDNGNSQGVVPICVMLNDIIRLCNQGSLRKGAVTVTLAIWHYDIPSFIPVVRKGLDRNTTAPDINNAIWTCRLFYERLKNNENWTLFSPDQVPDLLELYGDAFEARYQEYENDPRVTRKKVVSAKEIHDSIIDVRIETGMPYLMNGDSINEKSNQKHRGMIDLTNLCTEIVEYCRPGLPAVCNLHSLNLYAFYKNTSSRNFVEVYDFDSLADSTRSTVEILNSVFSTNYYPLDTLNPLTGEVIKRGKIAKANKIDRPIGLGVAGFSDVIQQMELDIESDETKVLNKMIFSCIYFNAWATSVNEAIKHGIYETFEGSPSSEGILQFDMWMTSYKDRVKKYGKVPFVKEEDLLPIEPCEWNQNEIKLDNGDVIKPTYDDLRRAIREYGTYNCMITSNMPTATSASVRGVCETTEMPQSNFYSRKLLAGAFPMINNYLQSKMKDIGLWNEEIVNYLKENRGSIKDYSKYLAANGVTNVGILNRVKQLEGIFKTAFESKCMKMIDLNADRSIYIDQSISMNHYLAKPDRSTMIKLDMYCYYKDMKTSNYYIRQPSNDITSFTSDLSLKDKIERGKMATKTDGVCVIVNGKASCCDS